MANNYDVLSAIGVDAAGATLTANDFGGLTGGYGQNMHMLIIPHQGWTISAADFTIGGSTPSASTAYAATGGVERTFTHGSGGCVLPNTYLTALKMRDTAAPHTSANMIAIQFVTLTGTFPTSNTTIQIDIDGSTQCVTHGYSFNEDIPSYWPTDANSFSGTNVLFWSEIVLNTGCTTCVVGQPTTIGSVTRRLMSGKCCANSSYLHYSRTFTCRNGFYFHNFPNPFLSVINSNSYIINEVVLVSDDTTGLPTSIRFDIEYICGTHSINPDKTDSIIWRTPECGTLPSPVMPRIMNNSWTNIMAQDIRLGTAVIQGGATVGLKITSSLSADYDVVLTQLDSATTYDFNTGYFTTKRTTLKQAPESLLQRFSRFGIEEWQRDIVIPNASSVPMYYQASIEPSPGTINDEALRLPILTVMGRNTVKLNDIVIYNGISNNFTTTLSSDVSLATDRLLSPCFDQDLQDLTNNPITAFTNTLTMVPIAGTTAGGTTGSTIVVADTSSISFGAEIAGGGVNANTTVLSITNSTTLVCNQAHGLGVGASITFANQLGIKRQPVSTDWTSEHKFVCNVLARIGSPSSSTCQLLVDLSSADRTRLNALIVTPHAASYVGIFGVNIIPLTYLVGAPVAADENTIITIANTVQNGINTSLPDIQPGHELVLSTMNGGSVNFTGGHTLTNTTANVLSTSVQYTTSAQVFKTPCYSSDTVSHVSTLDISECVGPYRKPTKAAIARDVAVGASIEINPFEDYPSNGYLDGDNFIFGGINNATIAVTGTSGSGTATVENNIIKFRNPTTKPGVTPAAVTITYTMTDAYGNATTGLTAVITYINV